MITCIGLDLAWSPRNQTGAAVVVGDAAGGRLADVALLGDDAQIAAYVRQHARTDTVLVAVDAPLCVPNQTGRRRAEADLGRVFARYEAGAYPANRSLLTRGTGGTVRGEELVAALRSSGFVERASIEAGATGRQMTEVYPHAAMVSLFGLERTLKYKARRRKRGERLHAWAEYQRHMRSLHTAEPALHGHEALLAEDPGALYGRRLKDYEDRVDALLCAYIALYAFRRGAARCRSFGSLEEGHIFTPVPDCMWC
jgi:predicted RNase H-like nuclease